MRRLTLFTAAALVIGLGSGAFAGTQEDLENAVKSYHDRVDRIPVEAVPGDPKRVEKVLTRAAKRLLKAVGARSEASAVARAAAATRALEKGDLGEAFTDEIEGVLGSANALAVEQLLRAESLLDSNGEHLRKFKRRVARHQARIREAQALAESDRAKSMKRFARAIRRVIKLVTKMERVVERKAPPRSGADDSDGNEES